MQGMLMLCLASGASALSLSATTARAPAAATRHAVPRMDATEDRIKELVRRKIIQRCCSIHHRRARCCAGIKQTSLD